MDCSIFLNNQSSQSYLMENIKRLSCKELWYLPRWSNFEIWRTLYQICGICRMSSCWKASVNSSHYMSLWNQQRQCLTSFHLFVCKTWNNTDSYHVYLRWDGKIMGQKNWVILCLTIQFIWSLNLIEILLHCDSKFLPDHAIARAYLNATAVSPPFYKTKPSRIFIVTPDFWIYRKSFNH